MDRLTRAGMHSLTRSTLGNVELAEPGERHLSPAGERVLDNAEDGIDCVAGLLLAETGLGCNLVDEF